MARRSAKVPPLKSYLPQRLREALGQKGWRPPELARQIEKTMGRKVDPSMVRRWVNGQKLPSLEYIGPLAAALGVAPEWLMMPDGLENVPVSLKEKPRPAVAQLDLSGDEIAERAAELVSKAAMRLYRRAGPRALADWLLKLSVEADAEEALDLQDFVALARHLLREADAAAARTGGGGEGHSSQ